MSCPGPTFLLIETSLHTERRTKLLNRSGHCSLGIVMATRNSGELVVLERWRGRKVERWRAAKIKRWRSGGAGEVKR